MTTVFLVCAAVGALLLALQFVVGLTGVAVHADVDHPGGVMHEDHGGLFFGLLSVRSVLAALTGFGLGGMAASSAGYTPPISLAAAVATGAAMMAFVVAILRSMRRLSSDGSVQIERAVDKIGTVYIPIPAKYAGQGKVQIDVQDRTLELAAVTHGPLLATGTRVRVVQIVDNQTAEVTSVGMG